jgi:spore coat polysaccharide biosynthesis protein SpsF
VFTTTALQQVNQTSNDPADHEHVSLHFWEHPEKHRLRNVPTELPADVSQFRLTVDTAEDFELIRTVYEELYPVNREFNLADVIELFRRKPCLLEINREVQQKPVR